MVVETCILTGELAALKTKIDLFLFAACTYITSLEQLAFFFPASLTSRYGQMIQKLSKVRILCKNRFVKHSYKTLCIYIKVAQ